MLRSHDAVTPPVRAHRRAHRMVSTPGRLAEIHEDGVNVVVWRRRLSATVRAWLGEIVPRARFELDLAVDASGEGAADLVAFVPPSSARRWLEADLRLLVRTFAAVAAVPRVKASFGVVETSACRKLHADWVPLRLLCTYAGRGTEWVPEHAVQREALVDPLPCPDAANAAITPDPGAIRRVLAGDVIVMKGDNYPGNVGRGAVHRSPPLDGTGERRLVLKISARPWGLPEEA